MRRHVFASGGRRVAQATIDIDSFSIEVHGKQRGAAYNGYYQKTVYHPLVASLCVGGDYDGTREGTREGNRLGNGFIHTTLRQGQVHTANGMKRFVDKTDQNAREIARNVDYRLDAGYEYTVDLGAYQVDSWQHAQRLILVVVDKPDSVAGQLNLMPRWFFLITNWSGSSREPDELLAHYRKQGTFEDRLGEFNEAIGVHLSQQSFQSNEATMLLALLAFNLNTICRNELEDSVGGCWDLQRFVLFVLKVSGEMVKHSRRLILRIAESAEPLWSRLIERFEQWQSPASQSRPASGFMPPTAHAHKREVLRW